MMISVYETGAATRTMRTNETSAILECLIVYETQVREANFIDVAYQSVIASSEFQCDSGQYMSDSCK